MGRVLRLSYFKWVFLEVGFFCNVNRGFLGFVSRCFFRGFSCGVRRFYDWFLFNF